MRFRSARPLALSLFLLFARSAWADITPPTQSAPGSSGAAMVAVLVGLAAAGFVVLLMGVGFLYWLRQRNRAEAEPLDQPATPGA